MNCLILEDEPLAVAILRAYIEDIPDLRLCAVCQDAIAAMTVLRKEKIDLLFVDIHLPKMSGLQFIKTIGSDYAVIITTAYHEHALEGFDLNVVDYLLKPIEFSRFVVAVNKVFERLGAKNTAVKGASIERTFQFFNVDKKQVKVYHDEITYIESLKDYVKIHYAGKYLVTKLQIGEIVSMLHTKQFVRVHKSYIVHVSSITAVTSTEIEIEKAKIPIGRTYRNAILNLPAFQKK